MRPPQLAASFNFQCAGAPSLTTVPPLCFLSAARIAACKSMACFRVAAGAFSAIRASVVCRAAKGESRPEGLGSHVPGGRGPSNWMPHFFAFEACSTATIWPFI
jgi:hypothetical protein